MGAFFSSAYDFSSYHIDYRVSNLLWASNASKEKPKTGFATGSWNLVLYGGFKYFGSLLLKGFSQAFHFYRTNLAFQRDEKSFFVIVYDVTHASSLFAVT